MLGKTTGLLSALASITLVAPAAASPEHLPPAIKYGARDCSFCHVSPSGGEGHNERGLWLVAERERREAEVIDVEWLAARDTLLEAPEQEERPASAKAVETLPELEPVAAESERVFDFTTDHGDWPAYGGNLEGHKYAPHAEIGPDNLDKLAVAWVWEAFDNHRYVGGADRRKTPDGLRVTPLMAAGKLLVRTAFSAVAALDPITGETLWTFDPGTGDGPRPTNFGFATRGLAYHQNAEDGGRILLVSSDGWLFALDPATGKPLTDFGEDGRVDLAAGLRRPIMRQRASWNYAPAVCGDVVVVGNQSSDMSHFSRRRDASGGYWQDNVPLGDVRAFDVKTGQELWVFKTVPQPDEFGNDTWENESWRWMGNTNVWTQMSCDPGAGLVYLPVSAPTSHFYGALRPGDNLFGTSLVAVDVRTGKRRWHFQTVRHDIWDYDLPAAPVVADLVQDGKPVKAVAQVSKVGFLYVFDRLTGAPLWPIEDRPVPASDLDGERAAKTQPFPTWPPPFELQGAGEDDLIDLSPELRERAKEKLSRHRLGDLFLPASTEGSLVVPGWGGGANWGGAAFDPETRMLYVASRRMPLLLTAQEIDAERFGFGYRVRPSSVRIGELPVVKPPWSSITAYRLDSGEIAWQVANGEGPKGNPLLQGLDLPDLGVPTNAPGLLVTKTAIFHGHRRGWEQPSTLRALDKATGNFLWEHPVQGTHSVSPPMTYIAAGKQFIVLATGTGMEPGRLTAFRLP